jgi:hypothetical protein
MNTSGVSFVLHATSNMIISGMLFGLTWHYYIPRKLKKGDRCTDKVLDASSLTLPFSEWFNDMHDRSSVNLDRKKEKWEVGRMEKHRGCWRSTLQCSSGFLDGSIKVHDADKHMLAIEAAHTLAASFKWTCRTNRGTDEHHGQRWW